MLSRFVLLILSIHACKGFDSPCHGYPSQEFMDVAMECSGNRVDHVPRYYLARSLQSLLLNATAITSLDVESFEGRDLPELTNLTVTGGALTRVGPRAFCPLSALTTLNFGHNHQLDTLDELSFSCNERLTDVSLANNPRLHNLPRLYSSSVERLDVSSCNLSSIDVATVEKMTALKMLNLTGNTALHCPSTKERFKQARPELVVVCEDSATELLLSVLLDVQNHNENLIKLDFDSSITTKEITTSEKPISESVSAISNNHNDSIGEEEKNSKNSRNETEPAVGKIYDSVSETVGKIMLGAFVLSYVVFKMWDYRVRSYRTTRNSETTQKTVIQYIIIEPPYTAHQQLLREYL